MFKCRSFQALPYAGKYASALFIFSSFTHAADEPAFNALRWNENYGSLAQNPDPDSYDKFKYVPLSEMNDGAYLSFGGSARSRIDFFENKRFGLQNEHIDHLAQQRFYFHADTVLNRNFRIFTEISVSFADAKNSNVGPFDRDEPDLSQGFLQFNYDQFAIKLGRQEMSLGSSRLVSLRNGPNIRLSFDGVLFESSDDRFDLKTFYLNPVEPRDGSFNNKGSDSEALWGIYTTTTFDLTNVDFYYLGLKRESLMNTLPAADEKRHSLGARLFGVRDNVDWNIEVVYQTGDIAEYDIEAWTLASIMGYRFVDLPGSPRVALGTSIASGDRDSNDRSINTFNPLFPNYGYFEEAGVLSPQNFYNIEPEISFNVTPQFSIAFDWNFFWRLEKADAVYVAGLRPLANTATVDGHRVTNVPSLSLDYQANRHFRFDISYSHFFADEVIKNSGGKDINYFKVQMDITF